MSVQQKISHVALSDHFFEIYVGTNAFKYGELRAWSCQYCHTKFLETKSHYTATRITSVAL